MGAENRKTKRMPPLQITQLGETQTKERKKVMQSCTLDIPRNELLAMRELQSKDQCRYILNAVHFEVTKDTILLVATDGRKIAVLKSSGVVTTFDSTESTIEFGCDYPLLQMLPVEKHGSIKVTLKESTVIFQSRGQSAVSENIEANRMYPKWRGVVPATPYVPGNLNINPEYLLQFHKAAKLLNPRKPNYIKVRCHKVLTGEADTLPYSVFFDYPGFYGAVMPVRNTASDNAVPDWLLGLGVGKNYCPTPCELNVSNKPN
jgi:hypothetical protein